MRKVALIAGAVVVAVGAVFAVGLFVGHWFGVGEEAALRTVASSTTLAWTRVTLPVGEAEARVGPEGEFPGMAEAKAGYAAAQEALSAAEATLSNLPVAASGDRWGMPEAWQGVWCVNHPRGMREAGARLNITTPSNDASYYWYEWLDDHKADFALVCGDVIALRGEVPEREKTVAEAYGLSLALAPYRQAVREARSDSAAAETHLQDVQQSYLAAVDRAVTGVVGEVGQAQGNQSVETIRAGLSDAEWVFCDLNSDKFLGAAVSLGFLPGNPPEDRLFAFWWVTRPDEYIRACKAAYALR